MIFGFIITLITLIHLVTGDYNGYLWTNKFEYKYLITSRTVTLLPDSDRQWSGVQTRTLLIVRPQSDHVLICKISSSEVADIHQTKSNVNWDSDMSSDKQLRYRPIDVTNKKFEIRLKDGKFQSLAVDRSMKNDEVNQLKLMVSPLQADLNIISATPETFKAMESNIFGECETSYAISSINGNQMRLHPDWAPLSVTMRRHNNYMELIKTTNFNKCDQRILYNFDKSGKSERMFSGGFLWKSSVNRMVLSESLKHFMIHSSVTTNKVPVSSTNPDIQNGQIINRVNVTLIAFDPYSPFPPSLEPLREIPTLVHAQKFSLP